MSKIFIDDTDPLYDWNKTAFENAWCTGNGTESDPYVIENVYIDGDYTIPATPGKIHSENCVSIYDSEVYFIIQNCTFIAAGMDDYDSSIYFRNVKHGTVTNNVLKNSQKGFYMDWHSEQNLVIKNRFIRDDNSAYFNRAIYSGVDSNNNTYEANYIAGWIDGFFCVDGNDNTLTKNRFEGDAYGITSSIGMTFMDCNYSTVTYNELAGDFAESTNQVFINDENNIGNTALNNTIVYVTPTPTVSIFFPRATPKTSSGFDKVIWFADSHHNYIAHNRFFIEGIDPNASEIPGYNVALLIGLVAVSSVSFAIVFNKKRLNKN